MYLPAQLIHDFLDRLRARIPLLIVAFDYFSEQIINRTSGQTMTATESIFPAKWVTGSEDLSAFEERNKLKIRCWNAPMRPNFGLACSEVWDNPTARADVSLPPVRESRNNLKIIFGSGCGGAGFRSLIVARLDLRSEKITQPRRLEGEVEVRGDGLHGLSSQANWWGSNPTELR